MRWLALATGVAVGCVSGWLVHGREAAPAAQAEGWRSGRMGAEAAEVEARAGKRADPQAAAGTAAMAGAGAESHVERTLEGGRPTRIDQQAPAAGAGPDEMIPPEVEAALQAWSLTGRSPAAAKALRKAGAGELAAAVEAIDVLRRAGHAALLAGDLEAADAQWEEAVAAERALLSTESRAAAELRSRLAAAWHERALLQEERQQLAAAFATWQRASAIDPTHVDSLAGLQRFELRAARLLAGGPDCQALSTIVSTTRQESATHREAAARLPACGVGAQGQALSAIPARWPTIPDRP